MTSNQKTETILPYVGIQERDEKGRIASIVVPASPLWEQGKRGAARYACVSIKRNGNDLVLSCRQHTYSDSSEGEECPALTEGNLLCYHCRAMIILLATESNCHYRFFAREIQTAMAIDLARTSGQPTRVVRVTAGRQVMYLALTSKVRKASPLPADLLQAKAPTTVKPESVQGNVSALPVKPMALARNICHRCKVATLTDPDEMEAGLCFGCAPDLRPQQRELLPNDGPYGNDGESKGKGKKGRKRKV